MMSRAVLLALLTAAAAAAAAAAASAPAERVLFEHGEAECNDGTPAGYYVRRSNASDVWMVWLQGGGLCFNAASCAGRPSELISSSQWPATREFDAAKQGIVGVDVNLVYVPYCTSDLYTGAAPASNSSVNGFSFQGSRVVPAVLEAMRGELAGASRVLFGGSSAGGVGVFTNAHYLGQRWANISSAPLQLLPDAGWFINSTNYVPGRVPLWVEVLEAVGVWKSKLDPDCVAANPGLPSRCVMGDYLYPYVKFPTFVFKAQNDAWTVQHQGLPTSGPWSEPETEYLERLAAQTVATIRRDRVHSVFSPNCVVHVCVETAEWSSISVGGTTLELAIAAWWRSHGAPARYIDTCVGVNCNPTCPGA